MRKKILVIEDNRDLAQLLAMHLHDLAFEVDHAYEGHSGLAKAEQSVYDLVILDLMLPGCDGLEICRRLRSSMPYLPILMLTAKSSEYDRVLGLETSADDYVTKPFSVMELMARVKALLRRVEKLSSPAQNHPSDIVRRGALVIHPQKRQVVKQGSPVDLTAKEFDLLLYFARHPGRVFTRSQLLNAVWGYSHSGYEHTVNSHMNRLRAKIEDNPAHPRYILTVWGVGYKFSDALDTPERQAT